MGRGTGRGFQCDGRRVGSASAPALTRERLERLRGILLSVKQGTTAPAEAVEQLEREAPELDAFLARLRRDPAAIAAFLMLLLQLIIYLLGHQGDTINLQHVTETIIQQCVQHPEGHPKPLPVEDPLHPRIALEPVSIPQGEGL
jgi:hypothetical protein